MIAQNKSIGIHWVQIITCISEVERTVFLYLLSKYTLWILERTVFPGLLTPDISGFIQASLSKIQGLLKASPTES